MVGPVRSHASRRSQTPTTFSSDLPTPRRSARLRARITVGVSIAEDSMPMAPRGQSQQSQHLGRSSAAAGSHAEPPLRRNLFQAQASRRPPGASFATTGRASPSSTASTAIVGGSGAGSVFGEDDERARSGSGRGGGGGDDGDDIVIRDKNGIACAVMIPALAFATGSRQEGEEHGQSPDEEGSTKAKISELLARRPRQTASDQEILDALNTSLQSTVDSLADDAWQFGRGI